jgi:outer membrane lipoprotein-sorting protein
MTRWIASLTAILLAAAALAAADAPATQLSEEPPAPTTRASVDVIAQIQHQLGGISTVDCDFQEDKNLVMLNHTLKIRGRVGLAKPNRLIWIVDSPVRYAVRIDGDEVRQWDEDTNQVQVIHLGGDPTFKAISEQVQGWFLGDYKQLQDSYDLYQTSRQPVSLAFIPRAGTAVTKLLKRIDITFNADETYIDTIVVREAGGDVTRIRFVNVRLNGPPDDKKWEMPPHEQ